MVLLLWNNICGGTFLVVKIKECIIFNSIFLVSKLTKLGNWYINTFFKRQILVDLDSMGKKENFCDNNLDNSKGKTQTAVGMLECWTGKFKLPAYRVQDLWFVKCIKKKKKKSQIVQVVWWNALLLLPAAHTPVCSKFWHVLAWLSITDVMWLQHLFKWFKPCNSKLCSSNQKKQKSNLHSKFLLGSSVQLALLTIGQHYSGRAGQNCCHVREDGAP